MDKKLENGSKLVDSPSERIRNRLLSAGRSFRSNENISDNMEDGEIDELIEEVALRFEDVLEALVIDTKNCHNTQETARRVAKMFVKETFGGRYAPKPKVTSFPNDSGYDQLYVTGPITVRSTCAHHFMPITGKAYIGVFPGKDVIGLSKFNRLTEWICSRPTIQEEMTIQVADLIEQETQAEGVAVIIKAEHGCLTHRGFKEHESDMTTSVMRGVFKDPNNFHLKQEFLTLISNMK